ncbi:MAG: hypothetical protein FWG89_05630 [Treponema sp.]|nr:hypothetical protein [Treponema sp.]
MKNTIKLFGIIALVAVIGLSMTACPTDGNGGNGGSITITINGLTANTRYYVSPNHVSQSGSVTWQKDEDISTMSNSAGTLSISFTIKRLKQNGFTGNCQIRYSDNEIMADWVRSINTYNMDTPTTHTLNAATDFEI